MPDVTVAGGESALDAIVASLADRGEEAQHFARRLYANLAGEDLSAASAGVRAAAALSLLGFARRRLPGVAKIRVFNPRADDGGWETRHTVVQLVNDDMPFLVDSVTAEFARRELQVHLIVHPVMSVRRDEAGEAQSFEAEGGRRESLMSIEIDRLGDAAALDDLAAALARILTEVRAAVEDWRAMRGACLGAAHELEAIGHVDNSELDEAQAFLRWIESNRFTFLGYRRYRYTASGGYDLVADSGLGILRNPDERLFADGAGTGVAMTGLAGSAVPLMLLKTDRQSLVHRPGPLDCIIAKSFDANGRPAGEHRIVGLFTSNVYHIPIADIPVLRRKVASVMRRAGFAPQSHDAKTLAAILEAWPRDELFQTDEDTLYDIALGVLQLQERQRVALFVRRDAIGRFATCAVFVPRDRYDSQLRRRFARILESAYGGKVTGFSATVGDESTLARVLFTVRLADPQAPLPDSEAIERQLAEAATTWTDRLKTALARQHGDAEARRLLQDWGEVFPTAYREAYDAGTGVDDLAYLLQVAGGKPLGIKLEQRAGMATHELALKLFHAGTPLPLSDVLPPLENMGLRVLTETPYLLGTGTATVWLHDFLLETEDRHAVDVAAVEHPFEAALDRLWLGTLENGALNRLILRAGLDAQQVTLLRTYGRFLRQAGLPFEQAYMDQAVVGNAAIARDLVALFLARHDPALGPIDSVARKAAAAAIEQRLGPALDAVQSLDEDRVLRRFRNAVDCTLRTNYFRKSAEGGTLPYLSIKLDSRRLDDLPLPRPLVEVFVYSPRVEGVHLRGGKVARGGIRWSDRREDFRSEVLGLMKAQMVKNAVIVPVGSKGGFYVKRPPAGSTREQIQAEGIECYRILIRGLLDVTDNLGPSGIIPPPGVVRHDADDPYLVVAADKGTATFSDIANALSLEYGFWLGDAFASGGSQGYDHKEMGITARGAWECIKRHFRELGTDIQATPFTVCGIGDMSGDVFGNGMLLSQQTKLLAAFDHRHIFLDPEPDPAASWAERKRLFDLPRSSWMDYDKALISAGGGVFERSVKSIPLSPQVRAALGVTAAQLSPVELMRAILKAQVDLLWFGGIGTYVRAKGETAAEIGDRANEPLRIDGSELRAKVLGEGANLGCTQRGRIEASQAGVRIDTDALHNSAGVDTSDHEVNIKIALGDAIARGELTLEERDRLLVSMTDEVGALVLRNNYQQSQAISVAVAQATAHHRRHARMMRGLARRGQLDTAVEFLPNNDAMRTRATAGQPLTRPELCVLLAYGKIATNDQLLASDLPDDPLLEPELLRYFPAAMSERFSGAIMRHRLRREIVALQVTNSMINRVGSAFVHYVRDRTGHPAANIARAFGVTRDAWHLRDLWRDIEALDAALVAPAQIAMLIATQRFVHRVCIWMLQSVPQPMNMLDTAQRLRPVVATMAGDLDALAPGVPAQARTRQTEEFTSLGAPAELAQRVAALESLAAAGDVSELADKGSIDVTQAARLFFALGGRLSLDWLQAAVADLPRTSTWTVNAANALEDDIHAAHRMLAAHVLDECGADADGSTKTCIDRWTAARRTTVERYDSLMAELRGAGEADLAKLTVALRSLRALVD